MKTVFALLMSLLMGFASPSLADERNDGEHILIITMGPNDLNQLTCAFNNGYQVLKEETAFKVMDKVKELLMIANKAYPEEYFEYPTIIFEIPRTPMTAGYADHNENLILINPLFLNKFGDQFIDEVVTHEVAHIISRKLGSKELDHHGADWRKVMIETFKVKNPKDSHDYELCP